MPEVVEVRGGKPPIGLGSLRELWRYREVLRAFAVRAVKVKYSHSVLGVAWAVLQPVAATAIFAVVFGRVIGLSSEGVPYPVFALAGMVAWTYVNQAVATSANSMVDDPTMLRKVFFPREVVPLAAIAATLVDLAPALVIFVVATLVYGIEPSATWVIAPVFVLALVMTVTVAGLLLSALNVYYRDVRHVVPFLLQVGLFASPVVYSASILGDPWREINLVANPIAGVIDGLRGSLLRHEWPDVALTVGMFAWLLVLLVAAYALFKRLEPGFADRV